MQKLFGLPIDTLMTILVIAFIALGAVLAVVAWRNRVMAKLAVRNVPRRRAQTVLIVLGLMLATLLFSASFATGDTLTHSARLQEVEPLGQVDVIIRGETRDAMGRLPYFDQGLTEDVRSALEGDEAVAGVRPAIVEEAPFIAQATSRSALSVDVLGLPSQPSEGFDRIVDSDGAAVDPGAIGEGQVSISRGLAEDLGITEGAILTTYVGAHPIELIVAGIFEEGAKPAGKLSLVMPLAHLQTLIGQEGRINSLLISNTGDVISGAEHTDAVAAAIAPILEGTGLEAAPVKQDAIEFADETGESFASIFLLFGQFSIAAGIMLIFLIFVMLAAERKRELGIVRAVGAKRGHVVRLFTFEGVVYALLAAAVGSILGVAVGWAMVSIMSVAFARMELELVYVFNWRSVVIAYTLGMVFTFAVVLASSWRASRLNIVAAVRNLPEPKTGRRGWRGLVLAFALPVVGLLFAALGLQNEMASTWMLGTSLVIIGVPLIARRLGLADRPVFTIAGLGLVVWWLLPESVLDGILPNMQQGIEMFFLSGIMIVLGAVWVVIYNSDLLLRAIVAGFGRVHGLPPVLRIAVSHPMQNRFRTGVTLAMFSLVVFTIVVMAFIISGMGALFSDTERLSGGFDVNATVSPLNPIADMAAALQQVEGVDEELIAAIGGMSTTQAKVKQDGTDQESKDFTLLGVDQGYTDNVTYDLVMMTHEHDTAREIWRTLQTEPRTALVPSSAVASESDFQVGEGMVEFRLEGFTRQDSAIPEVYVLATDPMSGNEVRLRVIGVLDEWAVYAPGIVTSQQTLGTLMGHSNPPLAYSLNLTDDADASAVANALEDGFVANGLKATVLADEIETIAGASIMVNNLLAGFMGLGLVVGIAALGVIAARSVVERRQQIGVLRALGFRKGMVQLSFLMESSFIALLGIAIGIVLGFALSYNIINTLAEDMDGVQYRIPWLSLAVLVGVAYGASLLTTYLPARQAASVYPAEALRYE